MGGPFDNLQMKKKNDLIILLLSVPLAILTPVVSYQPRLDNIP